MGKFKSQKEIVYQIKLEASMQDNMIDHKYQLIIKDRMDGKTIDMDGINLTIKDDVKTLIKLYQTGSFDYNDFYNKMIKIIGYNFMIEEINNKKSNEQLIEEGEEVLETEKSTLDILIEESKSKCDGE